jgi:hypothetical protein
MCFHIVLATLALLRDELAFLFVGCRGVVLHGWPLCTVTCMQYVLDACVRYHVDCTVLVQLYELQATREGCLGDDVCDDSTRSSKQAAQG